MDTLTERPTGGGGSPGARAGNRRWPRLVLLVAAVAIVASVLGYLIDDQASEHERFDHTRTVLDARRVSAADASHDLARLRHDVTVLLAQVATDTATWNQDQAQLKTAQAALAATQTDVSQQGARIGALHTCLGGVQQALNALSVNEQASAIDALNSVAQACSVASGG